ncbi:phytanoyl-CoA dioxygenase family protein [Frigidibacter sp. ROC022]|uniref:phytanoyl-CoA dioxygenase family protein n=1 Tax=Frigidibacter sp. ROC022 TaxID=2971796 RepID=UPI00215A76FC|nr:phytanoyl-CoA dioxygenase family protein [Frigidibacter sp. ROC022]MCR8725381.1 phytanoyl-CoA dioxygenase family protein [Frigidibacter sp. ROC022]
MSGETVTPETGVEEGRGSHSGAPADACPLARIEKTLPLRVLSPEDWRHWQSRGFVVVRQAVPREMADAVAEMLWQFQEMDPDDPGTWYKPQLREIKMKELNGTGMVEVYNHQSMWDVRQYPRVYDAFVDIWDREELWAEIDRANLNPPNRAARQQKRSQGFIHFDVDISQRPLPVAAQGVLSLRRQGGEIGGFQCVPSVFAEIDDWWDRQPPGSDPFRPDVTGHEIVNVDLEAGDLLIFNSLLAHGVRPNVSERDVRMAQYVSMFPADPGDEAQRQERLRIWSEQTHPVGDPFPGDPREFERRNFPRAQLDALGRRLLGLDPWT